jgi:hypothetical protein
MKKVLGVVLLVLAFGLVSVPAFAEKAELSLKYWHAGVGGADQWVADYQIAENEYPAYIYSGFSEVHQLTYAEDAYVFSKEKLVLQPGMGGGFILSGSYFLSPSASVGISYWGLNRAGTAGVEFIDKYDDESVEHDEELFWVDRHYLLTVPWLYRPWEFYSDRDQWTGYWDFDGKAVLAAEGALSMSALDIAGTKTLAGSGWEIGFSGGVRRAVLNQSQLTGLELSGGFFDEETDDIEYVHDYYSYGYYHSSAKWDLDLNSKLGVSAIGPLVGIEGKYALADKLMLKVDAKAGILFGTATSDAIWSVDYSYYDEVTELNDLTPAQAEEDLYEWVLYETADISYSATDSVQISTYDLSASLGYQITEQWLVEAGCYASLWKGVPSLRFFKYDPEVDPCDDPINYCDSKKGTWEQPEARDIIVSGLTLGVNFKF